MITKIISGGQTGADQAGLRVAYDLKIETGGWAPRNFQTLLGPEPRLKTMFNLQEFPGGYKDRTYQNVKDSDATLRLAIDFNTAGERCTLNAIRKYHKLYYDINLLHPIPFQSIAFWLCQHKISILNIAGNGEHFKGQNIFQMAYVALSQILQTYFTLKHCI